MYEVQALAAVPSMLIPSLTRFFVLSISRPNVQALCTFYSLKDGVLEFYNILLESTAVAGRVEGYCIEPSK